MVKFIEVVLLWVIVKKGASKKDEVEPRKGRQSTQKLETGSMTSMTLDDFFPFSGDIVPLLTHLMNF